MDFLADNINTFNDTIQSASERLAQSPQEFSQGLYSMVEMVNQALLPLATALLITYFFFSFYEKAVTFKMNDFKLYATGVLQLVVAITILNMNLDILEIFYWISNTILTKVQIPADSVLFVDLEIIEDIFDNVSIWRNASLALELFFSQVVLSIILFIANFVISFVIISRMFEIYIYLAFAPLALSSFVSDTTKPIFKGYITNFCAVVLKSSVIVFVMQMYQTYLADTIGSLADEGIAYLVSVCISGLLLITLIMGAEKITKVIVGSLK